MKKARSSANSQRLVIIEDFRKSSKFASHSNRRGYSTSKIKLKPWYTVYGIKTADEMIDLEM